jgi:AcrR family transcriptional regulator
MHSFCQSRCERPVTTGEPPLPPGLALAWGLAPAARRGPKPAHSVERIVDAALTLADEDGFSALSLPKIASRVGVTTNALYRYVSSKEELLVLLADAAWGPAPESLSRDDWRDAATGWVHAALDRCRVHPWLLDLPVHGAPATPNLLDWLEKLLESMAKTGLPMPDILGCAVLLDGYARSVAKLARDLHETTTPPIQSAAVASFLQPLLVERGYPILASMMSGGQYEDDDELPEADVEFGLTRILDGIEVQVRRCV